MTIDRIAAEGNRAKPRIILSVEDYERLTALADAAGSRMPDLAADLAGEIARAHVLAKGRHPEHIVPEDATLDPNMVSVLTPLGAALVGLSVGDTIDWCTATGDQSSVTVLRTGMNLPLS